MRPGAHQPAFLIGQPRQFHLQPPGLALRALAEDFEDKPGAVENLGVPGLFEVALLDRGQRVVDDDDLCLLRLHNGADFLNLARAEQGRGARLVSGTVPAKRTSSPMALARPAASDRRSELVRQRRGLPVPELRPLADGHGDNGPRGAGCWRNRPPSRARHALSRRVRVSSTVLMFSVLISVQERDGPARHDCRDRMLVDKLRMPVAPQQDAKIVEPSHNALQLYAVDQEDRKRRLVFSYVIEECIL